MGIGLGSEGQGGAWVLLGQQECKGPAPVPHSLHSHSGFGQENTNTLDFAAPGPWLLGKYSTIFYSNEFILIMDFKNTPCYFYYSYFSLGFLSIKKKPSH